jgi:hypothetical protein
MAFNSLRQPHLRGRPVAKAAGINGSKINHSFSVKSLGRRSPFRACTARVVSVHMCRSVDVSQLRLNHISLISPNLFNTPSFGADT